MSSPPAPLPWAAGVCAGLHAAGSRHVVYVPDNPLSHVLRVLARALSRRHDDARDARGRGVRHRRRPVPRRHAADGDAAVERPRQLAQRADVAARAVSDSGADRDQHARRRGRVERRAGADGPRGARRSATRSALPHATADVSRDDGRDRARWSGKTAFGTRTAGRVPAAAAAHGAGARRGASHDADSKRRACSSRCLADDARSSRASAIRPTTCSPPAIADTNFYTWGSMGLASSIGLGLALARPDVRVVRARRRRLAADESRLARDDRLAAADESRRDRVGQRRVRDDRRAGHGDGARRRPRGRGARDGDRGDGDGADGRGARARRSRGAGAKPGRG